MFYVNEEPEGKFLAAEIIKLYCIVKTVALMSIKVQNSYKPLSLFLF